MYCKKGYLPWIRCLWERPDEIAWRKKTITDQNSAIEAIVSDCWVGLFGPIVDGSGTKQDHIRFVENGELVTVSQIRG